MFIHKIITPMFIRRFECVGSECLSHCCQDWFISIDKKTYKKYHSADSIEIKQISQEHVLKSERAGNICVYPADRRKTVSVSDRKAAVWCLQQARAFGNE